MYLVDTQQLNTCSVHVDEAVSSAIMGKVLSEHKCSWTVGLYLCNFLLVAVRTSSVAGPSRIDLSLALFVGGEFVNRTGPPMMHNSRFTHRPIIRTRRPLRRLHGAPVF